MVPVFPLGLGVVLRQHSGRLLLSGKLLVQCRYRRLLVLGIRLCVAVRATENGSLWSSIFSCQEYKNTPDKQTRGYLPYLPVLSEPTVHAQYIPLSHPEEGAPEARNPGVRAATENIFWNTLPLYILSRIHQNRVLDLSYISLALCSFCC